MQLVSSEKCSVDFAIWLTPGVPSIPSFSHTPQICPTRKSCQLSLQKRGKTKPLSLRNSFFCYFNCSLTDTTSLPLPPLKSNLKTPSRDAFKISDHSATKTPLTASHLRIHGKALTMGNDALLNLAALVASETVPSGTLPLFPPIQPH